MAAAPGWYNDGSGTERYWDGTDWSDQTRPAATEAPATPPPFQVPSPTASNDRFSQLRRPRTLGLLAAVLVVVVGIGIWAAPSGGSKNAASGSSAADTLQTAYDVCGRQPDARAYTDTVSHLAYSGGALSLDVTAQDPHQVALLHCIITSIGAPQEFVNRLGMTGAGTQTDTFDGITANWSEVDNGQLGYVALQFYPAP